MSQNNALSGPGGGLAKQNATTSLWGGNSTYVEDLYERYLAGEKVPAAWLKHFPALAAPRRPMCGTLEQREQLPRVAAAPQRDVGQNEKQANVSRLIQVFPNRGH